MEYRKNVINIEFFYRGGDENCPIMGKDWAGIVQLLQNIALFPKFITLGRWR
jgi:hypothetical protein